MNKDEIIKALENEPIEDKMETMAPFVYGHIVDANLFHSEAIEVEPNIFDKCKNCADVYEVANEVVLKLVNKYSEPIDYGVELNDKDEFEKRYKDFRQR